MSEPFALGELIVEFDGGTAIIHGPARDGSEHGVASCEEALRAWLREDEIGRYRPLPTARTMRGCWFVRCGADFPLQDALEVIYPLARRHQRLLQAGTLRIVSADTVFGRQTGRYRAAARLPDDGRAVARDVLCGRCVKTPLWDGGESSAGDIPCPEPCSLMLSLCREAALWEETPPAAAPFEPAVAWAAFDEPGNEIREDYLRRRFGAAHNPEHAE